MLPHHKYACLFVLWDSSSVMEQIYIYAFTKKSFKYPETLESDTKYNSLQLCQMLASLIQC